MQFLVSNQIVFNYTAQQILKMFNVAKLILFIAIICFIQNSKCVQKKKEV